MNQKFLPQSKGEVGQEKKSKLRVKSKNKEYKSSLDK